MCVVRGTGATTCGLQPMAGEEAAGGPEQAGGATQ